MAWIADGESGSDVRAKLNAVVNKGNSESVTTGAAPIIADNTVSITRITTGGTTGNEDIYLPAFAATDPDGYTHVLTNGTVHTFVVDVQTDGNDIVRIYQADSAGANPDSFDVTDAAGTRIASIDFATLDFQGATSSFMWWDYGWFLINTQQNNSTEFSSESRYVSPDGMGGLTVLTAVNVDGTEEIWVVKAGVSQRVTIARLFSHGVWHCADGGGAAGSGTNMAATAGNAAAASNEKGGDVDLIGGTGDGTGNGGLSRVGGGNSGSGATGNGGQLELNGGHAQSTNGNGGDLVLYGGDKTGSGVRGHIVCFGGLENFADDAAAATGGVPVNGLYRTASAVKVRVS